MGLDTVELVMTIEDEFAISIEDSDAEKLRTVGDLYRYLLYRLDVGNAGPCVTQAAFYRFRRALIDKLGLGRDAVRPDRVVQDLLPSEDRRAFWPKFGKSLGWQLPCLVRPTWMRWASSALPLLSLGLSILAILTLGRIRLLEPPFGVIFAVICITLAALLPFIAAERMTRRYAVLLPSGSRTVRGLIGESLRLNYGTFGKQAGGPAPDLVIWKRVRTIVCKQMGVSPEIISEETSFLDFM